MRNRKPYRRQFFGLDAIVCTLVFLCLFAGIAFAQSAPDTSGAGSAPGKNSKWPACHTMSGSIVDVLANMDWNNAFPITFFGIDIGGGGNPPRLHEDAFCQCNWRTPGLNAIPYGIGLTFWNPIYIVETSKAAGCFITLPVEGLLKGYTAQNSGKGSVGAHKGGSQRRQIHFYSFPVLKMLDMFTEVFCSGGNKGFDLVYLTEIDPTWQNDLWAATFFPEGTLFSNVLARVACGVEAAKVNFGRSYPIDAMWWCLGAQHLYPVSGNSDTGTASEQTNMKALGRFLFRQHRLSALSTTIGKKAACFATYSPRLPKQQYRIDPVFPSAVRGVSKPIVLGRSYLFWKFPPPVFNYASHESGAFVLWRGTQCCLRF